MKENENDVKKVTSLKEKKTNSTKKKKKPQKEKKVIPKYYAGTEVRKLPKVPKVALKDLDKLKGLTMTLEQQEAYLTAIVLGFVPDKFGLEAGIDQKLKAMAMLKEVQKAKNANEVEQDEDADNDYLASLREALGQRKIEGVDD